MAQINLFREKLSVTKSLREKLLNQKAFVIWFTGLSGSGKSTLANALDERLYQMGYKTMILDGDNTRLGINKDLKFSDIDRKENIRRVAEMCKLFNEAGIIILASFISPFKKDRKMVENIIGKKYFVEVYVNASLEICIQRDPKGLYQKALNGLLPKFTGLDSPYEKPLNPTIEINTDKESVFNCLEKIISYLKVKKYINGL